MNHEDSHIVVADDQIAPSAAESVFSWNNGSRMIAWKSPVSFLKGYFRIYMGPILGILREQPAEEQRRSGCENAFAFNFKSDHQRLPFWADS